MSGSLSTLQLKNASVAALSASAQLSTAPAVLYGIAGYNSKISAQFIQLHDSATTPVDTAVPLISIAVAASSNYSIDFGRYGMNFVNGVYACNSSTTATKTIGAADCQFFGRLV